MFRDDRRRVERNLRRQDHLQVPPDQASSERKGKY